MPTLVVKRLIKPGFERDYEKNLAKMVEAAEEMEGYMGVNIARPDSNNKPLYIYSIKFDTRKHLQVYMGSPLRQELLKKWHEQSLQPIKEHIINGIDWWFVLPGGHTEIPRYKMILITILAAYPIVFTLSIFINGAKDSLTTAGKILVLVFITILIMSYVTMPLFLNLFKRWLQRVNNI